MNIIKKKNNVIEFSLEENDSQHEHEFHRFISDYTLKKHGAGIFIYANNSNKLVSYFNTFDNTQLICDPAGYEVASKFGTKRFLIGGAKASLDESQANQVKAIKFARDLSFPVNISSEAEQHYQVMGLAEYLAKAQNKKSAYNDIAELFNRCADFTPGKKEEYLTGGKLEDKYCRFNTENAVEHSGLVTEQVFLVDETTGKVAGTISAIINVSAEGLVDIYVYDEIVDYFTKLTSDENKILAALHSNETLTEEEKNVEIAKIIEPKRMEIMVPLFAAVQQKIQQAILKLNPEWSNKDIQKGIESGAITATIRAAAGRVQSYEFLGCSNQNNSHYVIHGPQSKFAALLDNYNKSWANRKLAKINTHGTGIFHNANEAQTSFESKKICLLRQR